MPCHGVQAVGRTCSGNKQGCNCKLVGISLGPYRPYSHCAGLEEELRRRMSSAQEAADEDADPAGNPDPNPAGGAPRPRRAEAVGARVRVQWPDDEDWYEGVVRAYSAATGRHNVWYPYDEQVRLPALRV